MLMQFKQAVSSLFQDYKLERNVGVCPHHFSLCKNDHQLRLSLGLGMGSVSNFRHKGTTSLPPHLSWPHHQCHLSKTSTSLFPSAYSASSFVQNSINTKKAEKSILSPYQTSVLPKPKSQNLSLSLNQNLTMPRKKSEAKRGGLNLFSANQPPGLTANTPPLPPPQPESPLPKNLAAAAPSTSHIPEQTSQTQGSRDLNLNLPPPIAPESPATAVPAAGTNMQPPRTPTPSVHTSPESTAASNAEPTASAESPTSRPRDIAVSWDSDQDNRPLRSMMRSKAAPATTPARSDREERHLRRKGIEVPPIQAAAEIMKKKEAAKSAQQAPSAKKKKSTVADDEEEADPSPPAKKAKKGLS